jgi:hypothetical protein
MNGEMTAYFFGEAAALPAFIDSNKKDIVWF